MAAFSVQLGQNLQYCLCPSGASEDEIIPFIERSQHLHSTKIHFRKE